jgi:hypothetical protein
MQEDIDAIHAQLKAPRAGAIAGILFSILLIISVVLIRLSIPYTPADPGRWLSQSIQSIDLALDLLPFAGIAFLWFMGVLRDRMGTREDRFLATVFLGSGLLFLAIIFVSSGVTGALLMAHEAEPGKVMDSVTYDFARTLGYELVNVYALRMAGVFMISTSTLAIRIGMFPRWMSLVGYALALFLLLSIGKFGWASLVFPLWTMMVSAYVLFANFRPRTEIMAEHQAQE